MHWQKEPRFRRATKFRPREQIGWRYKFFVYNPDKQRNEPVPVDQLPERGLAFKTDAEADAFCALKSAEEDAIKVRIQRQTAWMEKYCNFPALLEEFTEGHKERSPNNWDKDVSWLSRYVFHYFLDVRQVNNVKNWCLYFSDFKKWLETVKPLKHRKDRLAYNSMNKAIKALNSFLEFDAKKSGYTLSLKCEVFPDDLLNTSTAADVLEEHEIRAVHEKLKEICPVSADMFLVKVRSALRINEIVGLCVPFVKEGAMVGKKSQSFHKLLESYGLGSYFGYICLESQPIFRQLRVTREFKDRSGKCWEPGSVPRKPLKKRGGRLSTKIRAKDFRFIPIWDREAWKVLARRWNLAVEQMESGRYGTDGRDYLVFDGLTAAKFYRNVVRAFGEAKVRYRSPHKLRHTYCTWFYEAVDGNATLAEIVVGHRDREIMDNYNHIAEQRGLEAITSTQQKRRMRELD